MPFRCASLRQARVVFISVKTRLDKLLVDRGLTASRERAQALILAGKVLVNEQKIEKAGASIDPDSTLRLLGEDLRYVSRGGLKTGKSISTEKFVSTSALPPGASATACCSTAPPE